MKYEIELRITAPSREAALDSLRRHVEAFQLAERVHDAAGGGGPDAVSFSRYAGPRRLTLEERVAELERKNL